MNKPNPVRDSRAAILAAALEVFSAGGIERATIAGIRRLAGVSNGSFFHFFKSKEDVAGALYLDGIVRYQNAVATAVEVPRKGAARCIADFITAHLRWAEANKTLATFLFEYGRPGNAGSCAAEILRANASFGARLDAWRKGRMADGSLKRRSLEAMVAILIGPAQVVVRGWLTGRTVKKPTALAGDLIAAAVAALIPSKRGEGQ